MTNSNCCDITRLYCVLKLGDISYVTWRSLFETIRFISSRGKFNRYRWNPSLIAIFPYGLQIACLNSNQSNKTVFLSCIVQWLIDCINPTPLSVNFAVYRARNLLFRYFCLWQNYIMLTNYRLYEITRSNLCPISCFDSFRITWLLTRV